MRREDMPMEERIDRIGELLAKGVYFYLKSEIDIEKIDKDEDGKNKSQRDVND
ncbi:MAG: hypothetical protein KAJ14_11965 [Candidatus Omnitrophica bacterium]|nr:hypothetical protein [Candidatus Omnitrophota bacterium]